MIEIRRRTPLIAQKQWMEEQLGVFRDAILKSNNECYERDVSEGILDREEARLLLAHFLIKTKEITGIGADNYRTKPVPSQASNQYLTIGGRSINGDSMDNEISYLILEAVTLARVPQPEINVRIDTESPPEFKQAVGRAMQICASQIQLWNERLLLDCLLNQYPQVRLEDAYDYSFTACNRIDIPDRMNVFHFFSLIW
jgi:pyruvate-formate lyase